MSSRKIGKPLGLTLFSHTGDSLTAAALERLFNEYLKVNKSRRGLAFPERGEFRDLAIVGITLLNNSIRANQSFGSISAGGKSRGLRASFTVRLGTVCV